jgi:hypothetical protein
MSLGCPGLKVASGCSGAGTVAAKPQVENKATQTIRIGPSFRFDRSERSVCIRAIRVLPLILPFAS